MTPQPRAGQRVRVRVPASSANLGPGFDCLALALDLWNQFTFSLEGQGVQVELTGCGAGELPSNADNLAARSFIHLYQQLNRPLPDGVRIVCDNAIPLGSGLGSSAAAVLGGLLGANALLGLPLSQAQILATATGLEGHGDNAAAALLGGLTIIVLDEEHQPLVRRFDLPCLNVVLVVPDVSLPTAVSRAALPASVALKDAVYNLGRTALVVEALRAGDLILLGKVMHDRLHQARRLQLIPGGAQSLEQGLRTGASAVALSGAGPGLIAFTPAAAPEICRAMQIPLLEAGLKCEGLLLTTTNQGAAVEWLD